MRAVLVSIAAALILAIAVPSHASTPLTSRGPAISATASSSALLGQQNPIKVDVDVNRGDGRWYRSPVWIGIGVLALIVILLLIVLAARGGGGTTIVKD